MVSARSLRYQLARHLPALVGCSRTVVMTRSSIAGVCSRCRIWYMLEACKGYRHATMIPTRSYRQPHSNVPKFNELVIPKWYKGREIEISSCSNNHRLAIISIGVCCMLFLCSSLCPASSYSESGASLGDLTPREAGASQPVQSLSS
jgi:hypothetical protein